MEMTSCGGHLAAFYNILYGRKFVPENIREVLKIFLRDYLGIFPNITKITQNILFLIEGFPKGGGGMSDVWEKFPNNPIKCFEGIPRLYLFSNL